ncbi:family 2 glycosyl transferase [Oscillospiraceae bacterium PP1C4]
MKKFLACCVCLIVIYLIGDYLYYTKGVYFNLQPPTVLTNVKSEGKQLYLRVGEEYENFEIKGVDMGAGISGHFATDYAITKEDYLRWFQYIQDMGANTVRVYTILSDDFYEAVYEYNKNRETPLYIIHGLWVNDYTQYSRRDAYHPDFLDTMLKDSKTLVNVIHGKCNLLLGAGIGSGSYRRDISPWVIGYILGVEWEDVTVAYTNHMQKDKNSYQGNYMYTTPEATPFEAMLAQVGDKIIAYETRRYGTQRLVAFSNWPTTDPLDYPENVVTYFKKMEKVDVEHIKTTENFMSGTFASYHIYPYYPDYLSYVGDSSQYLDDTGRVNTYQAYLKQINNYHTVPVIISEFGIPSSRGMAQRDKNTGRHQGGISEMQQAQALVDCYEDIKAAGCAGSVIFTWQDEWFKRTWNTMHAVDLLKTPYWSDYQTNEQYFGMLSFDPGKKESICYVDGDVSEWKSVKPFATDGVLSLSAMYDEKFIYLLIHKGGLKETDQLYLPIDTTPKSGAIACDNYGISFDRSADFVLAINGRSNSRLVVQERYEVLRAMFYQETHGLDAYENPPPVNTTLFKPINLLLQTAVPLENTLLHEKQFSEIYETGLLTYGNANPESKQYNSLADFCYGEDYLEIKLPWQLLNFSNPSEMKIHDDYYLHYGVEYIKIKEMHMGIAEKTAEQPAISLKPFKLKGWHHRVTYHERLKPAYYAMKKLWNSSTDG